MLVQFKSKEFENKLRQTANGRKMRLQSFLETVEQLNISNVEFGIVRRDNKGFLVAEKSLVSDYQDRNNCLIDMDKFNKLKSLSISVDSRAYAHKWCRNIESMNLKGNTLLHVLPILNEFTKLTSLTCNISSERMPRTLPENITKQLKYLNVYSVNDMGLLTGLNNLEEFSIDDLCGIPLNYMPMLGKLKRFTGKKCSSHHMNFFSKMPNVNYININDSWIENISYVKKLHQLKELCVSYSCIANLEPLRNTSIEVLDISHNMVEDISPLENMTLTYLDISKNPVSDISVLKNQTNLELLHMRETWVTDISPILELPNLKEISFDIEKLCDIKQITLLKSKPIINSCRYDEFIKKNGLKE